MIFKLVWRNIWRNKRRTFITMASVFFSVILSAILMSMKEGVYSSMIDSVIGSYIGFGQVHAKGYWEEKTPDYAFEFNEKFYSKLTNVKGIKAGLERVEGFAMTVSDEKSKVAMVIGVNTQRESEINKLSQRVFLGSYFLPNDKAVLVGNGLADYLHVKVNDTVVLMGQGYHGAAANGKYPIKGIVKFGSPELSKQLVFLPLKEAQWFYGMEGMINNMVLNFDKPAESESVIERLKNTLGNEYEVMGWEEIMPDISNMIKTDRLEGYVFMFILYMVVSFGILGTTLMMLAERTREFGVLISVGMKRLKLALMVCIEIIMISVAGALLGIIAAYPLCWYFHVNPIRFGKGLEKMAEEYGMEAVMAASLDPLIFIQQAGVILMIASLISVYPFFKIALLNIVKAMRK